MFLARQSKLYSSLQHCQSIIERLECKLLLTFEMIIDTALLQSRFMHDIGKRRAEVSLSIEKLSGLGQNHLPRLFTFTHLLLPSLKDAAEYMLSSHVHTICLKHPSNDLRRSLYHL